jgi:ribulose 1,5-bisphosphate synthetase/thiazole synthase
LELKIKCDQKAKEMTVVDRPLDVLIVGAGIAGLSAAIALGKQVHRVVVSILHAVRYLEKCLDAYRTKT